ncbi:hypothetical protein HELRODRAFT_172512 [Helobdella robusta]|uniref:Uncharacterized protein n=1 Tax=Helobdella robusta TaxID=6412 RepID=T1F5F7_HELRO|nr:hypothetical protein HELRODRAFT_172512 [Helobdella robusta]ESO04169.1 hypothetical protein HELRODRAFT_172512 [Helobdella robusta]
MDNNDNANFESKKIKRIFSPPFSYRYVAEPMSGDVFTMVENDFMAVHIRSVDGMKGGVAIQSRGGKYNTDLRWKCVSSNSVDPNWVQPSFDDSRWPVAIVTAAVNECGSGLKIAKCPDVFMNQGAKWIWTKRLTDAKTPHDSSHCRLKFSNETSIRGKGYKIVMCTTILLMFITMMISLSIAYYVIGVIDDDMRRKKRASSFFIPLDESIRTASVDAKIPAETQK